MKKNIVILTLSHMHTCFWSAHFVFGGDVVCSDIQNPDMIFKKETSEYPIPNNCSFGNSMVVKLLILHTSTAGDMGSIHGQAAKILHAQWCSH